MAVVRSVLSGQKSEWVLMKRHPSEKIFGVQFAGNNVDEISRICQVTEEIVKPDFIDLNCGCPIDLVTSKGMAGVPRASLVVIAGMLNTFSIPQEGLTMLLAIDWLLDMGRSATNVMGNAVATAVVSKSEMRAEE